MLLCCSGDGDDTDVGADVDEGVDEDDDADHDDAVIVMMLNSYGDDDGGDEVSPCGVDADGDDEDNSYEK